MEGILRYTGKNGEIEMTKNHWGYGNATKYTYYPLCQVF